MPDQMSFDIIPDLKTGEFKVFFKRGFKASWEVYLRAGKPRTFTTWGDAWKWLVARNGGNVAYVLFRFCSTFVKEQTVKDRVGQ